MWPRATLLSVMRQDVKEEAKGPPLSDSFLFYQKKLRRKLVRMIKT